MKGAGLGVLHGLRLDMHHGGVAIVTQHPIASSGSQRVDPGLLQNAAATRLNPLLPAEYSGRMVSRMGCSCT